MRSTRPSLRSWRSAATNCVPSYSSRSSPRSKSSSPARPVSCRTSGIWSSTTRRVNSPKRITIASSDIDEAIEARLEQLRAERDELDVSDESRTSGEDKREATGDEASVDETPSSGRHCPECDRPLPRDAQFCSGCGLELDALECPDCGRELAADAQFCSGCGHELEDDSSETAPETEAGSAPPDEPSDEDIDADHAEDSEPPPPATSETEPRSQATG